MISDEYTEIAIREIKGAIKKVRDGRLLPVELVRLLFKFRDVFGDLSDPIARSMTALDSQTDYLIVDDGAIINKQAITDSDLDFFNSEILKLIERVELSLLVKSN